VLTAAQKLAVRKLYQDAGITSKAGDELNDASLFVNKLKDLAQQAGGDAPAPLPPAPPFLKELSTLSGNDLLFEVHAKAEDLGKHIAAWKSLREQVATRTPGYHLTKDLLAFAAAAQLPNMEEQEQALKAILQKRDLLAEPDPVAAIRKAVGATLRAALTAAFEHHQQVLKHEMEVMLRNEVWAKLSPEERLGFLRGQGIAKRDTPQMGSDAELATALRTCDLGTWSTHADALSTRCQNALEAAIRAAQPKARKVDLPKATINDEKELDAWLGEAKKTLSQALKDGPAII
jgi:hypothetical protein